MVVSSAVRRVRSLVRADCIYAKAEDGMDVMRIRTDNYGQADGINGRTRI